MWLETLHKKLDNAAECPTCGGSVCRRVYGEMHAGSSILNGQRVEIRGTPGGGFADPIYLDPNTQYFNGHIYRMWNSERYLSKGGARLHRDVWKLAFGEIPKGCHIHHRDSNPINNSLSNLECRDAHEHLSETWHGRVRTKHFSDLARTKAAEWHSSEEGKLWHSRHSIKSQGWKKWERIEKDCPVCGAKFLGIERKGGNSQIYCSANCKAASYRKRNKT